MTQHYLVGCSIDRPEIVSADHHIFMTRSVLVHLADLMYDRNLMTSTRDDEYDAWGHMLQVNAGVEMLWCFENNEKFAICRVCLHDDMMNGLFILTADSVRADLRITARVSTGAGADRGRSMNIIINKISSLAILAYSIALTQALLLSNFIWNVNRFCNCNFPIRRTHTHTHTHTQLKSYAWWKICLKKM